MKKWLFLLLLGLLGACDNDNDDFYYPDYDNSVVLLKVDYTDYDFEGGSELFLHSDFNNSDSLPITVESNSRGDFSDISLYYQPKGELLFYGEVLWLGKGKRKFPSYMHHPERFLRTDEAIDKPEDEKFQIINPEDGVDYPLDSIWNAIDDLAIVSRYLEGGKKIGVFRYTPSVGVGDPNDWDWYVFLNTQP